MSVKKTGELGEKPLVAEETTMQQIQRRDVALRPEANAGPIDKTRIGFINWGVDNLNFATVESLALRRSEWRNCGLC